MHNKKKCLDFKEVVNKLNLKATNIYVKIAHLKFNASTKRLESKGTVEVNAVVDGTLAGSVPKEFNLHHPVTGVLEGNTIDVVGLSPINDNVHAKTVQKNAKERFDALNLSEFTQALAMREFRTLGKTSNFIHWFLSDNCGSAIHRATYGQPAINSFLGSNPTTIKLWWKSAVTFAELLFTNRSSVYSDAEMDALGISAITLLVGPYTIPEDKIDGRNTKFASFNENGDCDKDALTAAAIYTMLRFGTPRDFDCGHVVANNILLHWKRTRGAAIMCHVQASAKTALGQEGNKTIQGLTCGLPPPMGHCIWGILPKLGVGTSDDEDVSCKLTITEIELKHIFNAIKQNDVLHIALGEATRPTTPNPNVIAKEADSENWKRIFCKNYSNLKYGTPNSGGWGEIKLLDDTQYPHLMQIYTAGGCCFADTTGTEKQFPSVCSVFRGDQNINIEPMSALFEKENTQPFLKRYNDEPLWNSGTVFDPHKERQDIAEITIKPDIVTEIDIDARLCNPRQKMFQDNYHSPIVITLGAATFGVFKKTPTEFVTPSIKVHSGKHLFLAKDHAKSINSLTENRLTNATDWTRPR